MRKALIAIVVASGLFAVGAFAAEFAVNTDDVASGSEDVVACATAANVDFTTGNEGTGTAEVGTDGEFMVTGAIISFTQSPAGACEGQEATIAVGLSDGASTTVTSVEEYGCGLVTSGSASCTFSHAVSLIEQVSVLVEENPVAVD